MWIVENATSGAQSINIKQGSGNEVTIATGKAVILYTDGAGATGAVNDALQFVDVGDGTVTSVGGIGTVNGLTLSGTSNYLITVILEHYYVLSCVFRTVSVNL